MGVEKNTFIYPTSSNYTYFTNKLICKYIIDTTVVFHMIFISDGKSR